MITYGFSFLFLQDLGSPDEANELIYSPLNPVQRTHHNRVRSLDVFRGYVSDRAPLDKLDKCLFLKNVVFYFIQTDCMFDDIRELRRRLLLVFRALSLEWINVR